MKKIYKILCVSVIGIMMCCGCGKNNAGRTIKNNNSVDAVIQNEIEKSNQDKATQNENTTVATTATAATTVTEATTEATTEKQTEQEAGLNIENADPNVDIDISVMSSDMVYATVYQIMSEPDAYVGKIIKIKGNHYSAFYEPTGLTYHYALIKDATACCAQGLEFQLAQGMEYPVEDAEVIVMGTFETYEEENYLYCRIKDCTYSVIQ